MAVVNVYEGTGTCYTYDAIGNLQTVTPCSYDIDEDTYSAISEEESVSYVYSTTADPRNLLHSITTGSTTYTFTYDNFGNSNTISAGLRNLASYEYNPNNGKLNTITYGNGFTVKYVYDELDNVKEVWYNGTKVYEYTYTAYGQVYRFDNLTDGTSTIYEYDPTGKLVHFTEYDSSAMVNDFSSLIYYDEEGKIDYYAYIGAYDYLNGNTIDVDDWSTDYSNSYHPDGRLKKFDLDAYVEELSKTASATVNFSYDKYNRLDGKTYSYSAASQTFSGSTEYTFTETTAATSAQVATYTSTVNGSSVTSTYTYDDNGYITKIVLNTGAQYRYVYDDVGQLKREDNTVTGKTYIYDYDYAGNIKSKKTYSLTAEGITPSSLLSSVTYGYNDSLEWGDKLTAYDGVTITYDAIGNPLTYYTGSASYTMTWTQGRRLASMVGNGQSLSFTYNADGIRTSKKVDGVTHYYHLAGTQILSEEWTVANDVQHLIIYHYDTNGQPVGMSYRNSTDYEGTYDSFLFVKNLQGDIIKVLDDEGNLLVSYTYDAWGNHTSTTYSNGGASTAVVYNPFRYRGYYYDSELGFYYLNSRYYDPAVGRFINADSIAYLGVGNSLITFNLFAYCGNNPINNIDPQGTWSWSTVGYIAAAVAITVVAAAFVAATAGAGLGIIGASAATVQAVATTSFTCGVVAGTVTTAEQVLRNNGENLGIEDLQEVTKSTVTSATRGAISGAIGSHYPVIGNFSDKHKFAGAVIENYIYEGIEYVGTSVYNSITGDDNATNIRKTKEDIVSGIVPELIKGAIKAGIKP